MSHQPNTQEKIIQATLHEISEHGIENLTTKKISKRANTSTGIIHHYFQSKNGLIYATYEDLIDQQMALFHKKRAEHPNDPVERVKASVRAHFDADLLNKDNARAWSQLWANAMYEKSVQVLLQEFNRQNYESLAADFAEFCAPETVRHHTLSLMALVHGYWIELQITKNANFEECLNAIDCCVDRARQEEKK